MTKQGAAVTYEKIIKEKGTLDYKDIPQDGHRSKVRQIQFSNTNQFSQCIFFSGPMEIGQTIPIKCFALCTAC